MPLEKQLQIDDSTDLGVWKVEEEDGFFAEHITLTGYDRDQLELINSRRRMREWYASRYLVKIMVDDSKILELTADEFNKPVILNYPVKLSITHAQDRVGVIVSRQHETGIDIEFFHKRVERIAHKFIRDDEWDNINDGSRIELMTLLWSAKESLYKLYSKKKLDFKEHMRVKPFELQDKGVLDGVILKHDLNEKAFSIYYEMLGDHVLTYTYDDDEHLG